MEKGKEYFKNRQYREALTQWQLKVRQNPKQIVTLYNMALCYDNLGEHKQAALTIQRIIDQNGKLQEMELQYYQGVLYGKAEMFAEAIRSFERHLKQIPNSQKAYFSMGLTYVKMDNKQKALTNFQAAIKIKSNYKEPYIGALDIYKTTLRRKPSKQQKMTLNQKIVNLIQIYLKQDPTDFNFLAEKGAAEVALQRYQDATDSFKRSIEWNKHNFQTYLQLAEAYHLLGSDQLAIQAYQQCQNNSNYLTSDQKVTLFFQKGKLYINVKQYFEAIECFRRVLYERPNHEQSNLRIARCYQKLGDKYISQRHYNEACDNLEKSLLIFQELRNKGSNIVGIPQGLSEIYISLGIANQNLTYFQKAEEKYRNSLSINPNNLNALNCLASLYLKRNQHQKAIDLFNRILIIDPSNYECWCSQGELHLRSKQYQKSFDSFQNALKIRQNDPAMLNNLSLACQKLERYDDALSYLNLANNLSDNRSPLNLINRADILIGLHRVTEAKKDFERAAYELRSEDKSNLSKFGITAENLAFMFTQLDYYAYLMKPVDNFRRENEKTISENKNQKKINEKLEKTEEFVLSYVIDLIENKQIISNPEVQNKKAIEKVEQQLKALTQTLHLYKQQSDQKIEYLSKQIRLIKETLHFYQEFSQSKKLLQKFDELRSGNELFLVDYGKKLYWTLNSYLTSYMLINTGVVQKGEKIDRSTVNTALKQVQGFTNFGKNIPVVGQFFDLISSICGLFIDAEDETIIQKMFQIIADNYDTAEELQESICAAVLKFLNDKKRCQQIKNKILFNEDSGVFAKINQAKDDICKQFHNKKNYFIARMRKLGKIEKSQAGEMAVMEVGIIISTLLRMPPNEPGKMEKKPVILNAVMKVYYEEEAEKLISEAIQREWDSLQQSTRCQLI